MTTVEWCPDNKCPTCGAPIRKETRQVEGGTSTKLVYDSAATVTVPGDTGPIEVPKP